MNRKNLFTWILLLGILVLLVGCVTDGLPQAMANATADAYTFKTQVASGHTDPMYATQMSEYHATEICETNTWYCNEQPTQTTEPTITPTPTATPSPTNTPIPTPTPFGGPLGTCFVLTWNINATLYEDVVKNAVRIYPSGIEPVCSQNSAECIGVHVYCFTDGVWDGIDRGIASETKVIETARPYKGWIVGVILFFVVILPLALFTPYIKMMWEQSRYSAADVNNIRPQKNNSLALRQRSVAVNPTGDRLISVKEFFNKMMAWDKDQSSLFRRYLLHKNEDWRDVLNRPEYRVIQQTVWNDELVKWNPNQAAKFKKWLRQN